MILNLFYLIIMEKYSPILGGAVSADYADIPIPTWEDWSRIGQQEGKYFTKCSGDYNTPYIPWNEKVPTAVFRGGSTGCGVTIQTNPRLKAAFLSSITSPDKDGIPLLDAGITNWNLRPRKIKGEKYLSTIEVDSLPFGLVKYLSQEEQARYKYKLCLDGHVTAFRLSVDLGSGSVVLLPKSKWSIWYMKFLKPYEHYIPIKEDLSDLIDKIRWCKENDNKCLTIVRNAKIFYDTHLSKNGILDYIQKTLIELKKQTGVYLYNYITPLEIQSKKEQKYINLYRNYPENIISSSTEINSIPNIHRCHALLKGLEWIYNFSTPSFDTSEIIFKSNTTHSVIEKTTFANYPVVIKNIGDDSSLKKTEAYHEIFVGKTCVNELLKHIPNFIYTLGENEKDDKIQIVLEHIEGISFLDYLQDKTRFKMSEYIFILAQLCLALHVAQQKFGFVHWDLMPWNIILQFHPEPIEHYYVISSDLVYKVSTRVIPIIIDYGKSHVIYNDEHYGLINIYKTSTVQDIISILVTSISVILTYHHLNDTRCILTLANFLSNSSYAPDVFKNIYQLNSFLHTAKKFSNLISTDKGNLENKSPLDLFNYLNNKIDKQQCISKVSSLPQQGDGGNPRQVFEFILSKTPEERIESYTNIFQRFIDSTNRPNPKSLLLSYYVAQVFSVQMNLTWKQLLNFLEESSMSDREEEYKLLYEGCISIIKSRHSRELNTFQWKKIKIKHSVINKLQLSQYNEETFLLPRDVLQFIREPYEKLEDITECRDVALAILLYRGCYEIPYSERKKFRDDFKKILEVDPLPRMIKISNRKTLIHVSRILYTRNIQSLYERVKEKEETL